MLTRRRFVLAAVAAGALPRSARSPSRAASPRLARPKRSLILADSQKFAQIIRDMGIPMEG